MSASLLLILTLALIVDTDFAIASISLLLNIDEDLVSIMLVYLTRGSAKSRFEKTSLLPFHGLF